MNRVNASQAYLAAYHWKMRLLRYYVVRRLASVWTHSRSRTDRIYVWPPFDERMDAEKLSSFQINIHHYLRNLDVSVEYYLGTRNGLRRCLLRAPFDETVQGESTDEMTIKQNLQRARYCVLWPMSDKPRAISLRPYLYMVAEGPGRHGSTEWLRLTSDIYRSRIPLPRRTVPFPKYPVNSCAVLGTGPSLDDFEPESDKWDAWIGANFLVCDERIRRSGRPFAICLLDPDLFSPLDSMRPLWTHTFALLRETPAVLITALDYAAFIELNFPDDVRRKCHYVKTLGHDTSRIWTSFNLPKMTITPYGNVLTDLMLPVATSISRSITLYGCDGIPPGQKGSLPKSTQLQKYDDAQFKEMDGRYDQVFYDHYFDRLSFYIRYVVDECMRQGVNITLRRPSWNAGLQGLRVPE